MSFIISKQEPVILYAGGVFGRRRCRAMLGAGFNIVAIADRDPSGVMDAPLPVHTAEECYEIFGNVAMIVVTAYGLGHIDIVKNLRAIGFTRALFLPASLRSKSAKKMIGIWNEFIEGIYDGIIPDFDALFEVSADDYTISQKNGFVTALVHKNHIKLLTKEGVELISKETDNPHAAYFFENKNLNSMILGAMFGSPIDDPRVVEIFMNETRNIARMEHYRNMLFDIRDFYEAPALAVFSLSQNAINIIDGNHRTVFLVMSGITGIPVRLPKEDWEAYFREPQAQEMMDYCKNLDTLPRAIKHPAFMLFPVLEREPDAEFSRLYNNLSIQ
ncbi:MAG: hypothetical protein LBF93_11810 [Zoogloeaceae bacterium]|jgi:hypothetical protein|nr:hypothetical protein [Zoogloeaceae bacterium]